MKEKCKILLYVLIFCLIFLLQVYAAHAADPAVKAAIVKFAPTAYLHPSDRYHPCSVENFLNPNSNPLKLESNKGISSSLITKGYWTEEK